MADYLSAEQKAEFIKNLEAQSGATEGNVLPPEAQQQALQEGAQMAEADAQNGDLPTEANVPPETVPENVDNKTLSQLGFGSVDELANAYREAVRSQSEMRDMLTQITAMEQAMGNEAQLDPNNPDDKVKLIVRGEIQPLLEKHRAEARNKLIQEKWSASDAAKASDIEELMPEIQAYLLAHPRYAVEDDGLQRAYDAVRSGKYRGENAMMADAEFLKRVAKDEQVRKMVIEDYLQDIARNGDALPQGIGSGGSMPMTGKKSNVNSMAQARQKLESMLGNRK